MQILGIVNVTRDSFSDGGAFITPEAAVRQAGQLAADGAAFIDLGAESTHPDAEDVSAAEEVRRLTPVAGALKQDGLRVSIDTYKPEVMGAMLELGVDMINDVTALADPAAVAVVRDANVPVILMHSTAQHARAERREVSAAGIVSRVVNFFRERIETLERVGVARERLILDPGMGFFLGQDPQVSVAMLRGLRELLQLGLPVCVSTSRKSFIGALIGGPEGPRAPAQRGAGTLATELWALSQGAEYVRTHDVRALCDAGRLWKELVR